MNNNELGVMAISSKVGLSLTYEKLAVGLCPVLRRRLTNEIRGHRRVMLEYRNISQKNRPTQNFSMVGVVKA